MTKYENKIFENVTAVPNVYEVAAAEHAYARQTRRMAMSIEAWEGENTESEWLHLDADMCELHADMIEDIANPESSEAYMQVVNEYVSMVEHNTPATGIYLYLPDKYREQLQGKTETVADTNVKLASLYKTELFVEKMLNELNDNDPPNCIYEKEL